MAKEREARLFGCCKMLEQTCPVPPRHEAVSRYDEGEGIELRRVLHASIGDELERTARGGGEKRSSASTQHEDREAKLRAIKQL